MKKCLIAIFLLLISLCCYGKDIFEEVYSNTLKYEGKKYVKTKIEESKFGISNYYHDDIKNLTKNKASDIAYKKIYLAHKIDKIENERIQKFIFDWVYHSSPASAIKNIQKELIAWYNIDMPVNGVMTQETINRINEIKNIDVFLYRLQQSRLIYVRALKHYKKYKTNWEWRIATVVDIKVGEFKLEKLKEKA